MKIYFVRHGHPDYANDCLTELGHKQAEAAARRLVGCGIERIFSSTMGRAMQTAAHTAQLLALEVTGCDFMREISGKSIDDTPIHENGNPWRVSEYLAAQGRSLSDPNWQSTDPYNRSKLPQCAKRVTEGLDEWLRGFGYQREGDYYRVCSDTTDVCVAMFSHGGASSVALSHMLNIPLPQVIGSFRVDFTSITVLELPNLPGTLVYPKLHLCNDAAHILNIA